MRNGKSSRVTLLAVLMFTAGAATVWAQAPQQTGDPPKADSSAARKEKKPKQTDVAAETPSETPAASPATANKPVAAPTAATSPGAPSGGTPASKPATAQQTRAANGGGVVWVNTDSRIYHKPGTRWYGKTKHGKYMTEADAKRAGYRAAAKE